MKKNQWKFSLKAMGTFCLLLAGIALIIGAANGNEKKIEGSWKATVTAVHPPVGSFAELITFEDKGTVIES